MATQYNQGQYSYRRRRRRGKPKRFNRKMRITVFLVFCVCLFTFGLLLFKIYRINSKVLHLFLTARMETATARRRYRSSLIQIRC